MTDYIKRIQSNLAGKKIKLSRPTIREELALLGYSNESFNDDLVVLVIDTLAEKFGRKEDDIKPFPDCGLINELSCQDSEIFPQNPVTDLGTNSVTELKTDSETDSLIYPLVNEFEQETQIVFGEGEKCDLITSQAVELGIELSEVEVVELATGIKDSFLEHDCLVEEIVTAIVDYHDNRTNKLEQKIRDAKEHIENRRRQLNQTLVGEFSEMNNFFRQGATQRKELSKFIAAAFKT